MRYILTFITLSVWLNSLYSQELSLENLPYKKNIKDHILKGEVFSEAVVRNMASSKEQSLKFSIAGLHKRSCQYALKTLSRYEDYAGFLSFVKESNYEKTKEEINFLLSHILLPYDMRLVFKLPRILTTGSYPFTFDVGILKNLLGKIHVMDHNKRCLFYTTAAWVGPSTGFSPLVFELFSQALSKLSMEILFRISSSLNH